MSDKFYGKRIKSNQNIITCNSFKLVLISVVQHKCLIYLVYFVYSRMILDVK